jgi:hypothetical protein
MPFVGNQTITAVGKANSNSIFRSRVVDNNFDELQEFSPDWENDNQKTKLDVQDTEEAERLIFNFISSCQAWRNRWEKVFRKLDDLKEEEVLDKLEEEYNPNKIAFMVHLRNYIVHNNTPSFFFEVNNGQTVMYITKDQDLEEDVKNAEEDSNLERAEKMSDFYRSQSNHIDLLGLAEGYHEAIVKTDQWANEKVMDKISE